MAASKTIKYLFFTFNVLFFLGGLVIFGLSIHAKNNQEDYQITEDLSPAVDLLIAISAVTFIFGFFGCYGTIQENRCALAIFFMGMISMFLMLVAVGALGAVARTSAAQEVVKENLKQLLPLSEQPADVQESFQKVEAAGFCCGFFVGHLDWGNSSTTVPSSCNCTDVSRNCTDVGGREVFSTPCLSYIMTWLDRVSDSLIATAFVFGVLMLLAMSFSCVLFRDFGKSKGSII